MDKSKRTENYDPEWMKKNMMGPNAIYLLDILTEKMNLKPGLKVLDLGCGMAMTSIFLAKEFGVNVWATDLWISATDNYKRIKDEDLGELVFPIHAEARGLPYADCFFDVVISIDAYHYFGTEDDYLDKYCANLIKPGGQIGIIVPGLSREMEKGEIPEGLGNYWEDEFETFHSVDWWKGHWDKSKSIDVMNSEIIKEGKKIWYESIWRQGEHSSDFDREMLEADVTDSLAIIMLIGRKKS